MGRRIASGCGTRAPPSPHTQYPHHHLLGICSRSFNLSYRRRPRGTRARYYTYLYDDDYYRQHTSETAAQSNPSIDRTNSNKMPLYVRSHLSRCLVRKRSRTWVKHRCSVRAYHSPPSPHKLYPHHLLWGICSRSATRISFFCRRRLL